ncbi:hypothetical protein IGI04_019445, partial [Brassica rapa subsp. trilocularis]
DDQIRPTEVQPFSRSRSTDRAVYRIDPRAPGRDLRMDPRPDDQISQTTGVLPRPIRHSRANSQARTHDHREESDSGLSLSFLARLGRTARLDQADHDLSNHFDDFMMIDASNYSKGRILKLSKDLGRAISSSNIHTSLGEVISKRTTSLCWTGASHPATFESLVVSLGYSATLSVTPDPS